MKISIILPAYNCADYISQTLDMVRLQSFPNTDMETIVFLDGCTDTTPEIVKKYAQEHKTMNLRIIDNKTNVGLSNARNTAVKNAVGDYIHFLDADDIINTDFYSALYDAATRNDADIAVASYIHERWPHDSVVFKYETVISRAQDKLNITRVDQHGYSWRYLIRRQFWLKNKLVFPVGMKYCEDMYIITRCVCTSNRLVTVPNATYIYKYRENSMLTHKNTDGERNRCYLRAKQSVAYFLNNENLKRTTRETTRTWFRLLDIIPLFVIRRNTEGNRHYVRILGILPILKTSRSKKNKPWKIL